MMIDRTVKWLMKHKILACMIIIGILFVPLAIVHCLYKLSPLNDFFVAEWSAGELLGYISAFLAFIGTILLGIVALWQNNRMHEQHMESLEPLLSMRLIALNGLLYLAIENTGSTEAKEVKIVVSSIENNGDNKKLDLDQLFESVFELYPNETVQGRVGFSGANIATQIFPRVNLTVSYVRSDINRKKTYSRTVTFDNGFAQKIIADVNIDNSITEDNIESVAYSVLRIANYLEGRTLFKFDKMNVTPSSSLAKDILQVFQTKEEMSALGKEEPTQEDLDIINQEKEQNHD